MGGMETTTDTQGVRIERLDDLPLLLALQRRLGLAEVIDQEIPRHWLHQGLSLGQLVEGWNAYILSQADHRKVHVRRWASAHCAVLSEGLGVAVCETDFTDDRLSQVLTHLSDDAVWGRIEDRLWHQSVQVYHLRAERVRVDPTTIHGFHTVCQEGLMQYGHSPDHPGQPQVKLVAASVDVGVNGHLVATDVVSGQRADDPLYQPILHRLRKTLHQPGLLYLGDSKMSAIATRADIVAHGDYYLVPLAQVGEVPALLCECVESAVAGMQTATLIYATDQQDKSTRRIAAGFEAIRSQAYTPPGGKPICWQERVLVIRSVGQADQAVAALQGRLTKATAALMALTPCPGRGHRQICDEATLRQRAEAILSRFEVQDYLHYNFQREQTTTTCLVGRGRRGPKRTRRTLTKVRYVITGVQRDQAAITAACWRLGWRLYATNQPADSLALDEAIRLYRQAPRIERHFHLLNAAPVGIEPLFVRRDDQIKGLTRLLSLGVRLLTLIEIVARRNLERRGEKLTGLYEGNPKQQTDQPTAIRLLRAFRHLDRVCVREAEQTLCYITPLSPLQRQILVILELSDSIYQTPFQNSG
jgi:transposase